MADAQLKDAMESMDLAIGKMVDQVNATVAQWNTAKKAFLADTPGTTNSGPTLYGQRNDPWAKKMLGGSKKYTIGQSGCLMTSYASIVTDAGCHMNPGEMNDWLLAHGGFARDISGDLCNFVFAAGDALNVTKYEKMIACISTPAPMAEFDARVAAGDFVIVKIISRQSADPSQRLYHWLRYIGPDGLCMDPWVGDVAHVTPRWPGKNDAEAIIGALYYKRLRGL